MSRCTLITFAAVLTALAATLVAFISCWRIPMENPLAPTLADLEQAYRTSDPSLAGHQQAEAVLVRGGEIVVLASQNPKGEGEHTWLLDLAGDGALAWEKHFDLDVGTGRAITELPGGGFAIAGDVRRTEMEYQGRIVKVGPDGALLAKTAFGPRGITGLVAVAALSDGSVAAGGTVSWKGWLLAADSGLRPIWELPLDGTEDVYGIVPRPGGGIAVAAAWEKSTTELGRTRILAFDADHHEEWRADLPAHGRGEPAALAAMPDGGLAMIGHLGPAENQATAMWAVRLSPTGAVVWEKLLGAAGEERRGRAIAVLADGGVAVAGDASRDGKRGLRVARLRADGTVVWERSFGGERYDIARGIARTDDGGLVVVGATASKGPGKTNVWIVRLDGDGRLIWDRVFGTSG